MRPAMDEPDLPPESVPPEEPVPEPPAEDSVESEPAASETPPEEEAPLTGPPPSPLADYFPPLPPPEPVRRSVVPVQVPPPIDWPPSDAPVPPPLGPAPLPDLERFPRRRPAELPEPVAAPPHPRTVRKRRSWPRRILVWLVQAILFFIIGSVLWVAAYRYVGPPITFTMIGDAIGGHGVTKSWMPLDRIDPSMARAAIAAEDARFCEHSGFDYKAIAAAAARNATGQKKIRGGSTISQQTAKNVFLWQGGGYFRKGLEAWFTVLIENIWGKRRIMEMYLNVAETGIGTYGVNAGSMRYFGHDASHMTNREAALIAAVLPLPKKRAAIDPKGFTRRYGNSINARIGVVRGDGLDACLR